MLRRLLPILGACSGFLPALGQEMVPGEVLVKYREGQSLAASAVPVLLRGTEVQRFDSIGVRRIRLAPGQSVPAAIRTLAALPAVEYAEPNYVVRAFETPNDPQFGPKQANLRQIHCEPGWEITLGSSEVLIAIIDTGVDQNHPDLVDKLVPGYDFHNDDTNPEDDHGHGTHCAGLAAAATNNGIGIAGVGWNCLVLPLKALGSNGSGSVSNIIAAMNYAASHGAKVLSMSLGTRSHSNAFQSAVNSIWAQNIVIVCAAGNEGNQIASYPGAYPASIAVASVNADDERSLFSNFGAWVDVAAPGASIYSTFRGDTYKTLSGTSMAAPQVAGLAALLWSYLGLGVSAQEIRDRIESNTIPVGNFVQKGRIDVERSLRNLGNAVEVRRTSVPTSFQMLAGQIVAGNLASLAESDDSRLELMADRVGNGRQVDFWSSFYPEWSDEVGAMEVLLEASSSPSGRVSVSAWNWTQSRWDLLNSHLAGSADRKFVVDVSDAGIFVGPKGEVRIRLIRLEDRNRLFRFRTDQLAVTTVSYE